MSKLERINSIVGLAHPRAVVVFTLAAVLIAAISLQAMPPFRVTFLLALAMALVQTSIGLFNEYYDRDLDAASKPARAIPMGHVRAEQAYWAAWLSLALGLGAAAAFGLPAALLLATGAAAGILYSARLKRSALSWLPYSVAYPILPLWVWVSLGKFRPGLLMIYPLAIPFSIAVHLTNQLRDYNTDAEQGMKGFAQYMGKKRANRVCVALLLLSPILPLLDACYRSWTGAVIFLSLALLHWLLVAQCLYEYRRSHEAPMWRAMFRRLQLSGPLLMIGWVLTVFG